MNSRVLPIKDITQKVTKFKTVFVQIENLKVYLITLITSREIIHKNKSKRFINTYKI